MLSIAHTNTENVFNIEKWFQPVFHIKDENDLF